MQPSLQAYTRFFPLRMSHRKSLIGCHVVVRSGESVTDIVQSHDDCRTHTGNVTVTTAT